MSLFDNADFVIGVIESLALLAIILQQLCKALGKWWEQTPGTPETEIFTRLGRAFHKIQRFLGKIVGDTSAIERARDRRRK